MNATKMVSEYMEKDVATVTYDTVLDEAFKTMLDKGHRAVVVVDDSTIMGLITVTDMARFIVRGQDLSMSSIRDYMTFCSLTGPAPCIQIRSDDTLLNALNVMVIWDVDMIVVVDENNEFAGTLDLMQALKGIREKEG